MNKAELMAITKIANKMNWQKLPVERVVNTINQMVKCDQTRQIETFGFSDDFEESLLTMALWDKHRLEELYCETGSQKEETEVLE